MFYRSIGVINDKTKYNALSHTMQVVRKALGNNTLVSQ